MEQGFKEINIVNEREMLHTTPHPTPNSLGWYGSALSAQWDRGGIGM